MTPTNTPTRTPTPTNTPTPAPQTAFDAATQNAGSGTTITFSHTTGSGANRFLALGIAIPGGDDTNITGVTYNGVALTFRQSASNYQYDALWTLVAPASGAHNIVITCNGSQIVGATVVTFSGVNQSTPLGTIVTFGSNSNDPAVTVAGASGDLILDVIADYNEGTAGTGQTERPGGTPPHATGDTVSQASTKAGGASVNMTWNVPNGINNALIGVAIKHQ